jgi:hypothetical protein
VSVNEAEPSQHIERITLCREMTAQYPAGSVTDIEFPDQGRILQSTLAQIAPCLGVVIELLPIEGGGLLQQSTEISFWSDLWIKTSQALAERVRAITGRSESGRHPAHSRDSKRHFCAC